MIYLKRMILSMCFLFIILTGCSNDEKTDEAKEVEKGNAVIGVTAEEQEKDEQSESVEKQTEGEEKLWPEAFKANDVSFEFPSTLADSENMIKGKWWGKAEEAELFSEDKEAAVAHLGSLLEGKDKKQQADLIKRFVTETYFPDFPSMTTFTPRGKINLGEVEEKSNIKLNGREVKENVNVAIILDASGSMKNIQDGKTLMDIAKESIREFASNLPEKANVSLTIYGHKGTGSEADKQLSCSGIEEVYPLGVYNAGEFTSKVNGIVPSGWTSMGASLKQVGEKLANENAENSTNVIYLVSDGKETCDGNPAEVAKTLAATDIEPIINVIGLAVNNEDAKALEQIAKNAEGRYITARNQQQLDQEFQESNQSISQWIDWHRQNTGEAINQLQEDKNKLIELHRETINDLIAFDRHAIQVIIDLNQQYQLDSDVYNLVYQDVKGFYNAILKETNDIYNARLQQINDTYNNTLNEINEQYNENI